MRLPIFLFILTAFASGAEIPKGSHVLLRLVNSVTTRTAKEGDYVYMKTATPVVANGQIVVPEGSYVQGVVSRSVRSGRVKGRAELAIRVENLTLPGGKTVRVTPHLASVDSEGTEQKVEAKEGQIQQGGTKGEDAKTIGTISATGAAIGGIADRSWTGAGLGGGAGAAAGLASVLLTRGREVELKQGSTIDVVFDRSIPMD
jgi:hypothetical protein